MTKQSIEFQGTFRRLIDLRAWDRNTVVGWLEDDHHHFGMTLVHDGALIQDVRIASTRHPWTTCQSAGEPMQNLIGQPLFSRCSDIGTFIDMRRQCTHLFDLAGLLASHAFHRRDHRRYEGEVRRLDSIESGVDATWLRASLGRDGQQVMQWDVCQNRIMRPEGSAGHTIDHGFREWIETLDEAIAEDAFVLRRAVFVAQARTMNLTRLRLPEEVPAVCHTYQPESREAAVRIHNSIRRFDHGDEGMLALVNTKP